MQSAFAQGTATTTAPAETDSSWFELERIEGDIDVGDFVVGPGRAEIVVSPGETIVQEITVTNRISENRTFKLAVDDITVVLMEAVRSLSLTERAVLTVFAITFRFLRIHLLSAWVSARVSRSPLKFRLTLSQAVSTVVSSYLLRGVTLRAVKLHVHQSSLELARSSS